MSYEKEQWELYRSPQTEGQAEASGQPEVPPVGQPEAEQTNQPEAQPVGQPEAELTNQPEAQPIGQPEAEPTGQPEVLPTDQTEAAPVFQSAGEESAHTGDLSGQGFGQAGTDAPEQPSGTYHFVGSQLSDAPEGGSRFSGGQPPEPSQPAGKKKGRFWPKAVACALACVILGGAAGVGGSALYAAMNGGSSSSGTTVSMGSTPVTTSQVSAGEAMTTEEIYAAYVDACVAISTEIVTTNLFGQTTSSAAAGSGFVLTSDGYIVTNYHVIEDASTITVTLNDGTEYSATLVGGESDSDVAVLKIDATGLTAVVIGDSDALAVGQEVSTIGNPLGEMTFSQTSGIVSALNRSVTLSDGTTMSMIQTDCTINSGNSGGPLFNEYGQVVGITSAKYSNNGSSSEATIEGIGFAIPINDVIDLITDIIENGYVTGKPSMGVLLSDVSTDAQRYGIPAGVEILAVLDGSCADTAGLQAGDIVTAVNGTEISSSTELQEAVQSCQAGDTITLSVYRDGSTLTLTVTLDESTPAREEEMTQLQTDYASSQTSSSGSTGSSDSSANADGSSDSDSSGSSGGFSGPGGGSDSSSGFSDLP
ncbi:MAG: trypsin-like peptidase domain-containing protein [Oscillospiraceae bacterium]|nr:trypsin-like peptidase domain-containing protein [Oscillospiraceae bacterium]